MRINAGTLLLVRHAQAVSNVEGTWDSHRLCRGLTEEGVRQSIALRDRLRGILPHARVMLMSSVTRRAVETARIIQPGLNLARAPQFMCDLCEIHPGELEGYRFRRDGTGDRLYLPHGHGRETSFAFARRARRILVSLAGVAITDNVVAVTHGGIVEASPWVFKCGAASGSVAGSARNASLTEWRVTREGGGVRAELLRFDDIDHLAAAPPVSG